MYYERKIAAYTLGCKLNFAETSTICRQLTDAGFERVDFSQAADYYIINTCSVTEQADKKCRAVVRQALRRAPQAKVIVIGCYAQLKPQEIAGIPGVDLVLGASEKFNLLEHIEELAGNKETVVAAGPVKEATTYTGSFSFGERTRTFLKVQDGCDYFCSFCTIPMARGRSRSNTIAGTLLLAQQAAATGVKEIVLTGVNTGDFGKNSSAVAGKRENFLGLIRELEKVNGVNRWRISSIEPNLLSTEIIEFVSGSEVFMPHFHIPLQSGSDKILKLMRRKYDRSLYASKIETIRSLIPDCCIGVDVIVGFPGETEADFLETYHYLRDLDIAYLHVFTYSERDHTKALDIHPVVPMEVRRERSKQLRILSEKKKRIFYQARVGETRQVLFEAENDDGYMYGFTDNYVKVKTTYQPELINQVKRVQIERIHPACTADVRLIQQETPSLVAS